MCYGCWDDYGKPEVNCLDASRLALRLQNANECGPLHIFVSDWNCSEANLDFCESQEGLSLHEKEIISISRIISEDQRIAALALCDGYYGSEEVR